MRAFVPSEKFTSIILWGAEFGEFSMPNTYKHTYRNKINNNAEQRIKTSNPSDAVVVGAKCDLYNLKFAKPYTRNEQGRK